MQRGIDVSPSQAVPDPVVEGDAQLRELLQTVLAEHGYTVYEAPNGVSALPRLRTQPQPLVVLLDWWMPGMDGLQVLQAIAADAPLAKRHAFILLSAAIGRYSSSEVTVPSSMRVTVMSKPFDLYQLLAAVAQAAPTVALPPPAPSPLPADQR